MPKEETFQEQMLKAQSDIETEETLVEDTVEGKEKAAEEAAEMEMKSVFDTIEKEHGVTKTQIEEWKATYYGKVFAVRFDDKESYIFRYVALPEWKQIIKRVTESKVPQSQKEDLLDELLVKKCTLFPIVDEEYKATIGAGTFPTVALQIKVASNFINEALALDMVTKL